MACRNGANFIRAQIQSILDQLAPQDELIISDDDSKDETRSIIGEFHDHRIRLFHNSFANATRNFNFALHQATGAVIFLADQDDVWLDGKYREMCEALRQHAVVVSDCAVVDAEGKILAESYFNLTGARSGILYNLWRNKYLGCCMAFRRELLNAVLPIPAGVAHDYWIGMMAECIDKPYFLRRQLLLYRRHRGAASFAADRSRRPFVTRVRSRVSLGLCLAYRLYRLRARQTNLAAS